MTQQPLHTKLQKALSAPLGIVAGCAGAILGAVIGLPAFAQSGIGVVLGGLAINMTSSLLDGILQPQTKEKERIKLLQTGLATQDPDVQAVVAALLSQYGEQVAQAIPDDERDEVLTELHEEMQEAGGPLEAIAPRYTAALRNPATNWEELQASLHPAIMTTYQRMTAQNIRNTAQEVYNQDGHIDQTMHATGDIEGSRQTVVGRSYAHAATPRFSPTPTTFAPTITRPADSPSHNIHVFLCHASEDKPTVRRLAQQLQADGITAWLDEERLQPGQDWQWEIRRAIQASHTFLVCLSSRSVSKTGYLNKEVLQALDIAAEQPEGSIFIIPVLLDPCIVPERLSRWQWVALHDGDGYTRLLQSLKKS